MITAPRGVIATKIALLPPTDTFVYGVTLTYTPSDSFTFKSSTL
jgi:hypothetical protein